MLAALLALVLLAAGSGRVFPQFSARALDAPEFLEAAYQVPPGPLMHRNFWKRHTRVTGRMPATGSSWICPGWKKDMSACPQSLIDG